MGNGDWIIKRQIHPMKDTTTPIQETETKYTIKYKTIVLGTSSATTWGESTADFTPSEQEITGKNLTQENYLNREWLTIKTDKTVEVKTGTETKFKIYRGKQTPYEEDVMEEKIVTSKHYIPLENVFEIIKIEQYD